MMKITGLSHLFKWENLHNWWLTKYFFVPLYICHVCNAINFFFFLLIQKYVSSQRLHTNVEFLQIGKMCYSYGQK